MEDTYFTIGHESAGLYKEKGSKFLSFAFPVESEDEALILIEQLKKEYHDARHHCYAYLLGRDGKISRAYDAGEPRHSAGDPILNQIRSWGLNDVLVVVVRYFGGTKLGKSGLINAYKMATDDALGKVKPIEKLIFREISIRFDYEGLNEIMRLIDINNLQITGQSYDQEAFISIRVKESELERIKGLFAVSPHVRVIELSSG
jgi:uncharacterized YigZ family protein